jgi:exodeoxyribonuclease-3
VNSLKARLPRVEGWIAQAEPDVLCLQETKLADTAFPGLAFEALGYEAAHHGEGRWNGVAVLSRVGLTDVCAGSGDGSPLDREARLLSATCGGVRVHTVYVPNGRAVDHEQYHFKLEWLEALAQYLESHDDPAGDVVVSGDFNIAPDDRDVWSPDAFIGATHVSEPERDALHRLLDWGLVDVFRQHYDDAGLYTWWDYRAGDFHQKRGLRIDLVLASAGLADRATFTVIDRNARKGRQPSDHAPLLVDFEERP